MRHMFIYNTKEEMMANQDKLAPPYVAYVKNDNILGMEKDKTLGEMFNIENSKTVNITENGTFEIMPDNGYGSIKKIIININIANSGNNSTSKYTGHADAEGLRAIGWTNDDITYYQQYGVNWDAEDDEYHKVSAENKALYGIVNSENIIEYSDKIVYLPKIDTSNLSTMSYMFNNCYSLIAIPRLYTEHINNMSCMFQNCRSLVCVPPLNTVNVTNMYSMFYNCSSLNSVLELDLSTTGNVNNMFYECNSLTTVKLKNLRINCSLSNIPSLDKESILFIVNNESAVNKITLKLAPSIYEKFANDPDILSALAAHPNISIAQ